MVLKVWRESSSKQIGTQASASSKKGPRLTNQFPPEILAKRLLNHQLIQNIKTASEQNTDMKIRVDIATAYVNNQVIKPKVVKPTTEDTFNFDHQCKREAYSIPYGVSHTKTEAGSFLLQDS